MNTLKIFFSDLTPDAQVEALKAAGAKDPKDLNWDMDIIPLAMVDFEQTEDEEEKPAEEQEYTVCLKVEGRFRAPARAKSLTEAAAIAVTLWEEADFGELEDIDFEYVNITDADDNIHDYMGGGSWS